MAKAAAVDAFIWFLEVDGLPAPPGSSHFEKHNKAFEIKDFSFSVENPTTIGSATGGAGAGKAEFSEFTITKTTDSASPSFFKNCCAGAHFKKAELIAARRAGDDTSDFLKFTMTDTLISSYRQSGIKPPPEPDPGPIDVAVLANADTIGSPNDFTGPEDVADRVAFKYANASMTSNPVSIRVRPEAGGQVAFDPKTGDLIVTEPSAGGTPVGHDASTDGVLLMRYFLGEYDVSDLAGLINAPFNTGALSLTVNEVRPDTDPAKSPPDPNLHFDLIMYMPADMALTPDDLTRDGELIGSLHVDPRGDPASLDVNLTNRLRGAEGATFGLRLQLRAAADWSGPGDFSPDTGQRTFGANFTVDLSFDTADTSS